jgi:hypothetical protein
MGIGGELQERRRRNADSPGEAFKLDGSKEKSSNTKDTKGTKELG